MRMFRVVLIAAILQGAAAAQKVPEIIFVNGDVYPRGTIMTSEGALLASAAGAPQKRAQAIAVSGGKILAIGSNEEIQKLRDVKTRIVDLGGHFVMPGFNDAHTHLSSGGFVKLDINLLGTRSLDEMKQRIAARARTAAPGEWLVGRGWDHTLWDDKNLPARQDIDAASGGHPGIFVRVDGHIAVANTAALAAMAITARTPDPDGGKIDRGPEGEPSGILRETAKDNVLAKIPQPTAAQRRQAIELALQDAAQWGVTSAQDNSEWEDFLVYEQLENEGKLTLRIAEWLPFDAPLKELRLRRSSHSADDPMLRTTMLKGFMDGSLGSRTAALLAPYADDPGNAGIPRYEQGALNAKAAERAQNGFQLGFHAIGDRGARMALEAFAGAASADSGRGKSKRRFQKDFRFRIEHAQVVAPEDFQKFKDLGVVASMQPSHLLTDMNWAEQRLGPQRASHSYAWKEFIGDGVPLAFGTDYPVEPISPFRGLYAAVTRKNEAGTKEYFPAQKITIDQAIAAYTAGSAYAQFAETEKGWLAPGMLADFVVLDRDIAKADPPEILKTRVLRTVVGGNTVYEAKP